jgi:hypothetical protein
MSRSLCPSLVSRAKPLVYPSDTVQFPAAADLRAARGKLATRRSAFPDRTCTETHRTPRDPRPSAGLASVTGNPCSNPDKNPRVSNGTVQPARPAARLGTALPAAFRKTLELARSLRQPPAVRARAVAVRIDPDSAHVEVRGRRDLHRSAGRSQSPGSGQPCPGTGSGRRPRPESTRRVQSPLSHVKYRYSWSPCRPRRRTVMTTKYNTGTPP